MERRGSPKILFFLLFLQNALNRGRRHKYRNTILDGGTRSSLLSERFLSQGVLRFFFVVSEGRGNTFNTLLTCDKRPATIPKLCFRVCPYLLANPMTEGSANKR